MEIELGEDVFTHFQYIRADNTTTDYARYTPKTPYGYTADPRHSWSAYTESDKVQGRTQPWKWTHDRQVAAVEWHNVRQGMYVCANNGTCVAPDTCACAEGWIGFDCHTQRP